MPQEGGLPEVLDALRWRWKLVLLIAAAVFAGGVFYAQSLPSVYEGSATASFSPRPDVDPDNVRLLLPKYVAFVTAPATLEDVAPQLDENPDRLEGAVDASIATDTGNLTIAVRLPTPERAADAANLLAEEAVDRSQGDDLIQGELVAEALPPDEPAAPPRRLLQAASLLVGLLIGVAVSFLVERGRPRLRSWRDIARITGYQMVGRIPGARILRNRPTEAFTEPGIGAAFRTMRTNLEREWQDRTVDVIIVTSPTPGDGKTTVSALFAESLARLGARVLLIDGDLRRPGLSRNFKIEGEKGLAAVLRQRISLENAISSGWVDGLSVLGTQTDAEAGDLLARRFTEVVRDARTKFDIVVVDTPPLIGTDDARTLATMASGVLLVVSAGSMSGPLNEAVLALETVRAPVLGVIANRVRQGKSSYYSYS